MAARVGVLNPDRIRILLLEHLPSPTDPLLRQAATSTDLLRPTWWVAPIGFLAQSGFEYGVVGVFRMSAESEECLAG
jgi:hypothetical protein